MTVNPPPMLAVDRPLNGPQAAEVLGISYDMWKYHRANGHIPTHDGVLLGRKYWLTSTVLGLRETLAAKPTHAQVVAALDAEGVDPDSRPDRTRVAADLGVHERTVYRHAVAHASGMCECARPVAVPAWAEGVATV